MTLKVAMAQVDMLVGDIHKNSQTVITKALKARDEGQARVIVFPELTLMGYPPEDLLLKPSLEQAIETALDAILDQVQDIYVILGYPRHVDGALFNCAGVLFNGVLIAEYNKQKLPNYRVFDDKRYFEAGNQALVVDIDGIRVGLSISEDIWHQEPCALAKEAGAQIIFNLNASPFHMEKVNVREALLHKRALEVNLPILYVNYMGAQDELVYEGGSFVVDHRGVKVFQAPWYKAGLYYLDLSAHSTITLRGEKAYLIEPLAGTLSPNLSTENRLYQALVLGLRDYVEKNQFKGVLVALNTSLESLLTFIIAVDALGANRVKAALMLDEQTSKADSDTLVAISNKLKVMIEQVDIEPMMLAYQVMAPLEGKKKQSSGPKLKARIKTLTLMTMASSLGVMALSNANKSEMALGCTTLYGGMSGSFSVLKDIFKSQIFSLCQYRNSIKQIIPPDWVQDNSLDNDTIQLLGVQSLHDYQTLDQVLSLYIGQNLNLEEIAAQTQISRKNVCRILALVNASEFKRRQSPLGVRVTQASFGRDRRYPISNGWQLGE